MELVLTEGIEKSERVKLKVYSIVVCKLKPLLKFVF